MSMAKTRVAVPCFLEKRMKQNMSSLQNIAVFCSVFLTVFGQTGAFLESDWGIVMILAVHTDFYYLHPRVFDQKLTLLGNPHRFRPPDVARIHQSPKITNWLIFLLNHKMDDKALDLISFSKPQVCKNALVLSIKAIIDPFLKAWLLLHTNSSAK